MPMKLFSETGNLNEYFEVGNFLFPFGAATASRMRYFALGLKEAGANVYVLSQNSLYDRPEDICSNKHRCFSGIPYESVSGFCRVHSEKRNALYRFLWFIDFAAGAKVFSEILASKLIEEGYIQEIKTNRI